MQKGETRKFKQYLLSLSVFILAFIILASTKNTSFFLALDTLINTLSVKLRVDFLVALAHGLSIITDVTFMLIYSAIIILTLFIYKKRKESIVLASILGFTALAILTLKELIGSVRPINQVVLESGFSFPSGHATFATVFFGILIIVAYQKEFARKKLIAGISIATILAIALARIYLNVHWFTDIIGGVLLGGSILMIGLIIQTLLRERNILI